MGYYSPRFSKYNTASLIRDEAIRFLRGISSYSTRLLEHDPAGGVVMLVLEEEFTGVTPPVRGAGFW